MDEIVKLAGAVLLVTAVGLFAYVTFTEANGDYVKGARGERYRRPR